MCNQYMTQRFTRLFMGLLIIAWCGRLTLQLARLLAPLRKRQCLSGRVSYSFANLLYAASHTAHSMPAEQCQVPPPEATAGHAGTTDAHAPPLACHSALLSGRCKPQHGARALRCACSPPCSASNMAGAAASTPRCPG